jgi:hypothetical protein
MSDAKFRWFDAMYHDDGMPITHRGILGYCGIRYAKESDGYEITVRQETIADNLGIHINTVAAAFASGRRREWVVKTRERQRGRGYQGGDTHTLSRPREIPTPTSGYFDENTHKSAPEYPHGDVGNSGKYPQVSGEIPTSDNFPTSENAPPKGLDTGFSNNQGLEAGFGEDALSALFGPAPVNGQRALEAPKPPRRVQSTRPLADDEVCPKHLDEPDPDHCVTCRAYARGRGERPQP